MNKWKSIALFICLFVGYSALTQEKDIPFDKRLFESQKLEFEEAAKEIKLGDFYFFDGRDEFLMVALSHFEKAQKFNPYSSILNYKIGICYLYSSNKSESLHYLEFAHKVNPTLDIDLKFYLAQAYQLDGNFETAIQYYKLYQNLIPANDKRQQRYVAKKISESRTGIELMESPIRVWVDNLGDSINSEYSEFSPVISADNRVLFYTSRRPDSQGQKTDRLGKYYEDIYYSMRNSEEEWAAAENIGAPVNTESHDATVGVAADGKSILTYQGLSSKNGDILITKQNEDGSWETPKSLGVGINSKHHESSATLSFDEKTLFFVSDQPGGYGQHDIYVSTWNEKKQEWGKAKNLGPEINTDFEEMGVFFHADSKTLYFSSDGHKNMGGLDVFKSVYDAESKEWSEPENIGYPINTPDDDIYFVVTGNNRYAYYSSNRPGGFGEKDIYKITFLGPKKIPALPTSTKEQAIVENEAQQFQTLAKAEPKFLLTGRIIDGETGIGMPGQLFIINAQTNERVYAIRTHPDGSYSAVLSPGEQYALTAAGKYFSIGSQILTSDESFTNQEKTLDFVLYPPTTDGSSGNSFALRNIYFGFDQTNLDYTAFGSQAQVELDLLADLLEKNPTIIIELGGHTDRRGASNYNEELSNNRAFIAKQYLVDKGIDEKRIKMVGYGETQPEVAWEVIKDLKDKKAREEAHQRNRRTVITILSQ
ncbi:MAG: OmpA family protein [Crocinitomix sp.]|nr:OmpA family protein [Crocinitomix sp.]